MISSRVTTSRQPLGNLAAVLSSEILVTALQIRAYRAKRSTVRVWYHFSIWQAVCISLTTAVRRQRPIAAERSCQIRSAGNDVSPNDVVLWRDPANNHVRALWNGTRIQTAACKLFRVYHSDDTYVPGLPLLYDIIDQRILPLHQNIQSLDIVIVMSTTAVWAMVTDNLAAQLKKENFMRCMCAVGDRRTIRRILTVKKNAVYVRQVREWQREIDGAHGALWKDCWIAI